MSSEKPVTFKHIASRILSSQDPYVILGISRNADKSKVESAKKSLLKLFHPDVTEYPDKIKAEEITKKINNATDTIFFQNRQAKNSEGREEPLSLILQELLLKVSWDAYIFLGYYKLKEKLIKFLNPNFKLGDCDVLKKRILSLYAENFLAGGYFNPDKFVSDMDNALCNLEIYDDHGFVNLKETFLNNGELAEIFKTYRKKKV